MTISMDPNLAEFVGLILSWHGILTALGVVGAVLVAARLARRTGVPTDYVYGIAIWAILGGIIGARLFHVIDEWEFYVDHPSSIFRITDGGIAIWGAVVGGFVAGAVTARIKGFPIGKLADIVAPGMMLGQVIGRIGCTINGDAWGARSGCPWCVTYRHPDSYVGGANQAFYIGQSTHPWPIYEMVWMLAGLFVLSRLWGRLRPDGSLFVFYVAWYALGRFFLTYLREQQEHFLGLQEAHIVSIAVLLVVVPLLAFRTSLRRPHLRQLA